MKILKRVNEVKSAKIDGRDVYFDKLGGGIGLSQLPFGKNDKDMIVLSAFVSTSSNHLELYKNINFDVNEVKKLEKENPKEFEKFKAKREKELEDDKKKVLETIKNCCESFEKDLKASLAKLGYKE